MSSDLEKNVEKVGQTEVSRELNRRQRVFCEQYARHFNAARAARESGVSPENAARTGYRWLHDPKYSHVLEFVDELVADSASQRRINHDLIIQRLRSRLTVDMREYWDENGQPKNPQNLPEELAQHVKSSTYQKYETLGKKGKVVQQGVNASIALSSDMKAIELLGRHSGFFSNESKGDEFSDYLQADKELEGALAELEEDDELLADFESAAKDAAARQSTDEEQ